MSDVTAVVEGLDLVVGLADGHLHPDDLAAARRSARTARERVGHLGATLVAALVGGTGVGKSSLLNALAGERIASTSPVRPHTTEPLAWVPARAEPALGLLLDRLGVVQRHPQERVTGLAILDLTDVDSVAAGHRERVEQVIPSVDVVIWVLDPLKYADADLHRNLLAPLSGSSDRMVFALNQIDTVPADERGALRAHLEELLQRDGFGHSAIFEVAADPPRGPRLGIDALYAHLTSRLDEKRVHLGRVVEEARMAARRVAAAAGLAGGGSLGFEERWESVRTGVVQLLTAEGPRIGRLEEALRRVEHMVGSIAAAAGGVFGLRTRQVFGPERVEEEVRAAVAAMDLVTPGAAGSSELVRQARAAVLDTELQFRIGAPLRRVLWERASLAAVVAGLAVDSARAESHLGIRLAVD